MAAVRTLLGGLVTGLGLAVLVLAGVLEPLELGVLDRLFELRGPRGPTAPIVIVAIDEDSFDELDLPWPFPRALHATLLDRIRPAGPAAVGLDILFLEPSSRGPRDDARLAEAIARTRAVVLAAAPAEVTDAFYRKVDPNLPRPGLRRGAAAVGPVNFPVDGDGAVRRAPLRHAVGDRELRSFAVHLHRLAAAAGVPAAPLPSAATVRINYRGGPRTFPWIPYHRVVRGEVPAETFRGKIVLVGTTSPLLQDVYSTPFARARQMPGVEIHANALATLLAGDYQRESPLWASALTALAAALIGAWLVAQLRVLRALAAAVGLVATLAAGAWIAFILADTWIRVAAPALAVAVAYGTAGVDNFVRERQQRRRLAQFFSPAVLDEIARHRRGEPLGSRRREVTVLFSDLRGFSAIAERLQPEEVVELLREFLTEMTDVVFANGGTVDKYIGDCIMALFNVPFEDPDHAASAVRAALALQERAALVSARWERRLGAPLRCGVGINTGEAVVGAMGSRQRLEYSAVGDTVNLAAHLETLTKELAASIIVSEATWERVRGRFLVRALGEATVKGRTQPVRVWSVIATDVRKHPRAPVAADVTVRVTATGRTYRARTRDLGADGCGLVGLPADPGPGLEVEIRCEGGPLRAPVTAGGTVAWRLGDEAGVTFTGLPPASAAAIADAVAADPR